MRAPTAAEGLPHAVLGALPCLRNAMHPALLGIAAELGLAAPSP